MLHNDGSRSKIDGGIRGVVVNFDLGERFPRPRSQQQGSLRPRARRVAVLGWVREGRFKKKFDDNPAFGAIWARK